MFGCLIFTLTASGLLFSSFKSVAQEDLGATGTTLSVGYQHSCVVTGAGNAKCWGWNLDGQASVPEDLGRVTAISAGGSHTCAVTEEGTVRCWGNNDAYQLDVPEDLGADSNGKVTQISAGAFHTCALTQEWWVQCWGSNDEGQTDQGGSYEQFQQIVAGGDHTCGLKSNGDVKCWGGNNAGESNVPFLDHLTLDKISAGKYHTCVVTTSGEVQCWGDNDYGQSTVPEDLGKATQISAGGMHTCSVSDAGVVRCWGDNNSGQSTVPEDLGKVTQISTGYQHSCAVQESGTAICWGNNDYGQTLVTGSLGKASKLSLGEKSTCVISAAGTAHCWDGEKHCWWNGRYMDSACYHEMSKMPSDLGTVTDIAVGDYHTCAITTASVLRCWGSNLDYQLEVPENLGTVQQVSAFGNITCVINDQGILNCWGYDFWWVQPSFDDSEISQVSQVALGTQHYCVVERKSTWCWGDDGYGQASSFEVQDSLDGQVSQVAVGRFHTCAVTNDGIVSCWGGNDFGQTEVPDDLGSVSSLTLGEKHSCAITTSKTVKCWGDNEYTQLDVPTDLSDVAQISAVLNKSCAITEQGLIRCWGSIEPRDLNNFESYGEPIRVLSFKKEFEVLTSATISGSGKVGTKLTAKPGNISPTPDYTYQWFKFKKDWDCWCDPIALGSTYTVKPSDLGYSIAYTITAKKSGYIDYSEDTKPKVVAVGSLVKTPSPKILGVAKVRQTVSTFAGSWDSGVVLSYQWLRNGAAISKATSAKYKLAAADKGKKISIKVTGKKPGFQTVSKTSEPLVIK